MAVDLDAMRKAQDEKQRSADFYTFDEAATVIYIAGPCRDEDPLPFVELKQHRGKGKNGRSFTCLDPEQNKVLTHPAVVQYLKEQGKKIAGGCPQCEEITSGKFKGTDEELKRARASSRYLWNIAPIKYRRDARMPWTSLPEHVVPCFTSFSAWDGIMDVFANEGDITDVDGAVFCRVEREGKGQYDTEYKVHPDSDSLRKPVALSKALRTAVALALQPGGTGDLYKIIASLTKS